MNLLEKNLAILRRVDEGLARKIEKIHVTSPFEVSSTRSGHLTLKLEGLSMHSGYDPLREAEQLVKKFVEEAPGGRLVFVLGMGLGYHVEKLLEVSPAPVILVEPNPEIFRNALENLDLEVLLLGCRRIFVGEGVEEILAKIDDESVSFGDSRIFIHRPSMKMNRDYCDRFTGKVTMKDSLVGLRLNVLVVPPVYGGSLPVSRYVANAFRKLGHRVTVIDNSLYYRPLKEIDRITSNTLHRSQLCGSLTQHLSERVMAKCLDLKPDLIFALAQAPLTPDVLDRMRQFEFTTAFWFVEDCREFTYWKQVASKYDCFFAIQKREIFGDLESLGATEFHYLPLGCDPNVHRQIELSDEDEKRFSSDASFVGAGYYNRQVFFQGLLDLDFKIWGTDWNLASPVGRLVQEKSRRVTPRETVKIFNGSKININLHSSTYHQGVNPQGDFVNPRTFEIAACQGFQVADPRSHLPELFEPDQEVVCFETIEDLREKVAYYLAHPEERECIATRGQERANRDHTYLKRVTRALELIVEKVPSRFLTLKEKVPTPERLIVEAGADTELGRFLSRFKRQDALTLDSIVSDIEGGEGKLTEPEIIFLLMHEFSKYKAGAREGSGE